jgi:hypothetical protein
MAVWDILWDWQIALLQLVLPLARRGKGGNDDVVDERNALRIDATWTPQNAEARGLLETIDLCKKLEDGKYIISDGIRDGVKWSRKPPFDDYWVAHTGFF